MTLQEVIDEAEKRRDAMTDQLEGMLDVLHGIEIRFPECPDYMTGRKNAEVIQLTQRSPGGHA